jgi:hypothetical protein
LITWIPPIDHPAEVGEALLQLVGDPDHPPGISTGQEQHGGHGERRHPTEDRIEHDEHGHDTEEHPQVGEGDRRHRVDEAHLGEIARRPCHQFAGAGDVVEREGQPLHVLEHPLAQVDLRPIGHPEAEVAPHPDPHSEQHTGAEQQQHQPSQRLVGVAGDGAVDHPAHQVGDGDHHRHPQQGAADGQSEIPSVSGQGSGEEAKPGPGVGFPQSDGHGVSKASFMGWRAP